ncbi:MAG: hypothetical protein GY820_10315 [Gammaproteobacteria bacterium]|nr:hypothetical protein [Gammaproteobacteria bacterium]
MNNRKNSNLDVGWITVTPQIQYEKVQLVELRSLAIRQDSIGAVLTEKLPKFDDFGRKFQILTWARLW